MASPRLSLERRITRAGSRPLITAYFCLAVWRPRLGTSERWDSTGLAECSDRRPADQPPRGAGLGCIRVTRTVWPSMQKDISTGSPSIAT